MAAECKTSPCLSSLLPQLARAPYKTPSSSQTAPWWLSSFTGPRFHRASSKQHAGFRAINTEGGSEEQRVWSRKLEGDA